MKKTFENSDYYINTDTDETTSDIDEALAWKKERCIVHGVHSEVLLGDYLGVYIPQLFYKNFDFAVWGLKRENYSDLDDPDCEGYWDTWNDLLNIAEYKDTDTGLNYYLEQDGDLFAKLYI